MKYKITFEYFGIEYGNLEEPKWFLEEIEGNALFISDDFMIIDEGLKYPDDFDLINGNREGFLKRFYLGRVRNIKIDRIEN